MFERSQSRNDITVYHHSCVHDFLTGLTGPKYASFALRKDPRSESVKRKVFCRHLFVV